MKPSLRANIPAVPDPVRLNLEGSIQEQSLIEQFRDDYINAGLLVLAWTALLGDSPLENGSKPTKVVRRFFTRLSFNLKDLIKAYATLGHALMKSENVQYGSNKPYLDGFEKTPVYTEYLSWYRGNRDPALFKYLLTFCFFGKKAYFQGDKDLEATAFRKWLDVEEKLSNLTLPLGVKNLRLMMSWIFRDWSPDQFLPAHGPGAVAEKRVKGVVAKSVLMRLTPLQVHYFMAPPTWEERTPYGPVKMTMPWYELLVREFTPGRKRKKKRAARLTFVPKQYDSKRSICPEPVEKQYLQQGVRLWIERHISKSILKDHVFLHDQGKNREAARTGSKTRRYDTIDLSSASDSVAWELVKAIFPYKVLKYLAVTRSSVVIDPMDKTKRIDVFKYAPMGSALCFPIQCTIYSAVALMVGIAQAYGLDWNDDDMSDLDLDQAYHYAFGQVSELNSFLPFYVYGDDIISDNRMTSNIIEALEFLGFSVNVNKSFTGADECRESCGGYYLNGNDITPYMFKPKRLQPEVSIESLVGMVDLTNQAKEFGYLSLRRTLISYCLHTPIAGVKRAERDRNPILFSSDPADTFAILVDKPINDHLESRGWYRTTQMDFGRIATRVPEIDDTAQRFQREEVKSLTMAASSTRPWTHADEPYRYTMHWRSRYNGGGNPMEGSPVAADVLGTDVAWRWTAKP